MAQYVIESQESIVMNGVSGTIFCVVFDCDNGYHEPGLYFVANNQDAGTVLTTALVNINDNSPKAEDQPVLKGIYD